MPFSSIFEIQDDKINVQDKIWPEAVEKAGINCKNLLLMAKHYEYTKLLFSSIAVIKIL